MKTKIFSFPTFSKLPSLKPLYQIQFYVSQDFHWGDLLRCRGAVGEYSLMTSEVIPVPLCPIDEIELFNHWLNLRPFMLNRINSVVFQYFKSFNCVQIKLLVLDNNTQSHFTVCKQRSSGSIKNNVICKQIIYIKFTCNNRIWH